MESSSQSNLPTASPSPGRHVCFVQGCPSSHKSGARLFMCPSKEPPAIRRAWMESVPNNYGRPFDPLKHRLCSHHFQDDCLLKSSQVTLGDQILSQVERKNWGLKPGSIPTKGLDSLSAPEDKQHSDSANFKPVKNCGLCDCNYLDNKVKARYSSLPSTSTDKLLSFLSHTLKMGANYYNASGDCDRPFCICAKCEQMCTGVYKLYETITRDRVKFEAEKEQLARRVIRSYCWRKNEQSTDKDGEETELFEAWKCSFDACTQTDPDPYFDPDPDEYFTYFEPNSVKVEAKKKLIRPKLSSSSTKNNTGARAVAGATPHKCPSCPASYKRKDHLRAHALSHTTFSKVPYECPIRHCSSTRLGKSRLKNHLARHPAADVEELKQGLNLNLDLDLLESDPTTPTILMYYECDWEDCRHNYYYPNREGHMRVAHGLGLGQTQQPEVPIFKCLTCPKIFSAESHLANHISCIHPDSDQPLIFDCPYCEAHFGQEQDLAAHQEKHRIDLSGKAGVGVAVENSNSRFLCHGCGKQYGSSARLSQHKNSCRFLTDKKARARATIPCEICGKCFQSANQLQNHSFEHEPNHPGFTCEIEICGKTFTKPCQLGLHKSRQHANASGNSAVKARKSKSSATATTAAVPVTKQCHFCPATFPSPLPLRRHSIQSHPTLYKPDAPFHCDICWTKFLTPTNLDAHNAAHHTNLACGLCPKEFRRRKQLAAHEASHKGQLPCGHCGKAFKYPQSRRAHLGLKRLQCALCEAGFYRRRDMDAHMNKSHPKFPNNGDSARVYEGNVEVEVNYE